MSMKITLNYHYNIQTNNDKLMKTANARLSFKLSVVARHMYAVTLIFEMGLQLRTGVSKSRLLVSVFDD